MKLTDVYRLIVTVFVSVAMATGCTNNAEKKADNERKQLSAEREQVAKLQKEAETKQAQIKSIEADLKQKVEALSGEKNAWDQDRSARELQITELAKVLEGKKHEVVQIEKELTDLAEKNAAEIQSIEMARTALEEQKQKTESELAAAKEKNEKDLGELTTANSKFEEEQKIAKEKADLTSKHLQEKQADLDRREANLKEAQNALVKSQEQFVALQAGLAAADARLQQSVLETREMFKRDGLADVFDKLQADKKMRFLVSVVGRGTDKYASQIQTELNSLNKGSKIHTRISSKPKNINDSYVVDNQTIVETTVGEVKAFRDSANNYLEKENKSGVAASATSLFVVARPIQKIRIGMKMTVNGSKSPGFEKRQTGLIMELNQIRAIESKIYDIDQVDLNNPGSYVFASDADGRKCNTVDLECLKVLKDKGLLNSKNVLMARAADGQSLIQVTNLEALTEVMAASIQQMNSDYELYTKGMSILAIDYSVDNGFDTRLDTESVRKIWNLFTGIGETRLPIVDNIELSYRIVMIDEISNNGNPLDTWKYMSSGVIQNVQMFAADRQRNEVEIQLPVGNLKTSRYDFQNLGLADYKIKTAKPEFNIGNAKSGVNMRGANAVMAQAKIKYEETVKKERTAEYKSRLKTNMGMQQIYIDTLKAK